MSVQALVPEDRFPPRTPGETSAFFSGTLFRMPHGPLTAVSQSEESAKGQVGKEGGRMNWF